MHYIIFGRQGSGKGTQVAILKEKLGFINFETGGALREISQKDTELGRRVKDILNSGNLVDNATVMDIVEDFIENMPEGKSVIFDGIPRFEEQRESLEEVLTKKGIETKAILVDISNEEAMTRLTKRVICNKCKTPAIIGVDGAEDGGKCNTCADGVYAKRADDKSDEAVKKRLEIYTTETEPVVEWYESQGRLIKINGEQDIDLVTEDLLKAIS